REITELASRADRDVVLAKLAEPVTNITPAKLAAAPAQGAAVTVAGFGRTKTEWVPGKIHTSAFTLTSAGATSYALTSKAATTDTVCKGDSGGPVLNSKGEVTALASRSWQGGCLGTSPTETRTNAVAARVDDLGAWIEQTRVLSPGWKTETLIQAGSSVHQGIRLSDGYWTGFTDVQAKAGNIGGIRSAAAKGIDGDTHVLAISNSGVLFHTVRKADGTWGTFGDVGTAAGVLGNLTQVSTASIGMEVHVVAVADRKVFITTRKADGNWTKFADLSSLAGPIGSVTAAATASTGSQLQITAIAGGKAYHTGNNGQWSGWGNIAGVAGTTGPITSVSMDGAGNDAHIVIATDNGTRQYHSVRYANGNWAPYGDLKSVLGTVTAKSVAAAAVDGELQLAVTTADNKALHTIGHTDLTWSPVTPINLQGTTGSVGAVSITGTN
ncbi:trypsin-like serine protease, partial [Streptomyces sp. NPDC058619]